MVRGITRHRHRLLAGATVAATVAGGMALSAGTAMSGESSAATPALKTSDAAQVTVGAGRVALNQPADPYFAKIAPSVNAHLTGMYSPQVAWPMVGIHTVLLPNGHVVSYGTPPGVAQQAGFSYDDWNPAAGAGAGAHAVTASMHQYDAFCNSLERLPDGRLLMVGGNSVTATMIYDPVTGRQTMGAQLGRQRWYASVLRLPDDRMLTLGGGNSYNVDAYLKPNDDTTVATVPEIGTGTGNWTALTGADSTVAFGARDNRWWYPRAYVAPDGKVFGVSYDQMWRLDPSGAGRVTSLGTLPTPIGVSGSSVMYAPGKLLFAGGGQHNNGSSEVATEKATLVDINGTGPAVTTTGSMRLARNWLNLTVLPNGEVLANGGTRVGTQGGAANSTYDSEIWNAGTGRWRNAATAKRIRSYHSTAVLMPSGSVLTTGGGVPGPETNFNAEIYYPPYLFTKGSDGRVRWANRPQITGISGSLTYGGTVSLGLADTRKIASLSLIRASSVTHSYNTDQRRLPLSYSQNGATVTARMPADPNLLPPGSYLLSGVDTSGRPTPAQMITIKRSGAGTVTVYEKDHTPADFSGPTVKVEFPSTDGYIRAGGTLRIEATDRNGIAGAELLINGKPVAAASAFPSGTAASLRWSTTAKDGTATMTIRARDALNNISETKRQVRVDNRKPTIRLTGAPRNNSKLTGKVSIAAAVSDNLGINRVEMLINGTVVATDRKAAYRIALYPNRHTKKFTMQLRAYDHAGNVVYSAKRTYRR
ncbi:exported oxidase [Actinoplanes italicus]|uniref:Glyoxal oxidase-like protein n=1 Tax=Actinoplanes italicus TaxID=113567 RepID=A0A2T0KB74_9ACTN|nr:galactose oxidase-like domain-containing protein [Actinoplanes italicus]PRX20437.1 glyoxal oxidase-like protein [Actinoplanes italicus]GIE36621.1 exported oxidase [Actinoplanes italicus]